MDQNFTPNYGDQQPNIMQMSMYQQQMEAQQRQEQERRKGGEIFGGLAVLSLIYTVIYTVCLYKNTMGITMPIWACATLCYANMVLKAFDVKRKKDNIFFMSVIGLLGISTFLTGNKNIVWMNYCAIFVLLIIMLLHNFAQDEKWNVGNYLSQIVVSVFGALAYVTKPFYDASAFYKSRRKKADSKGAYIVIGVLISCVCVFFLGLLLMSADSVFEDIVMSIFENICLPDRMFSVLLMLCFGFFSSYCGMRYLEEHGKTVQMKDKKNGEPLIAIIVTGSIAAMYLMFCAIQVVYLFVGRRYLMGGNAYAEYAREGFFQLLFVCMINLFLVLIMKNRFRESKVLNVILMIICACTFIMIASSAYRMIMYIEKYHLTFLRVFVLVSLFVITLLMLGVIAMIAKPEFSFFRYALVTVSVVYLIFSFAHVDYFIAKYNLAQSNGCETDSYSRGVDYYYIIDSSTDCAPAVAEFAKEHGIEDSWVERYINAHESEMNDINIRNFNVSHYVAHCLLSE